MTGTHQTAGIQSNPPAGFTGVGTIFSRDFTTDFGTVTLAAGLAATHAVTGLLTTDRVLLQCTGVLPLGVAIANARCSVNGTLEVRFTTSIVAGLALGSLGYRVTIFR